VTEWRLSSGGCSGGVLYAMGITDVDDKILARAAERQLHPAALAAEHEAAFHADMAALGVRPPTALLRVTEHVDAIVELIRRILSAGFAYAAPSGVYFDVPAWGARYGAMAP
jgi:cysteinyl-tRNA synthetase